MVDIESRLNGMTTLRINGEYLTFKVYCNEGEKYQSDDVVGVLYCPSGKDGVELADVVAGTMETIKRGDSPKELGSLIDADDRVLLLYDTKERNDERAHVAFTCTNGLKSKIDTYAYVYGYLYNGDYTYLMIEPIQGTSLEAYVEGSKEDALSIRAQLTSALTLAYKECGLLFDRDIGGVVGLSRNDIAVQVLSSPSPLQLYSGFHIDQGERLGYLDVTYAAVITSRVRVYIVDLISGSLHNERTAQGLKEIASTIQFLGDGAVSMDKIFVQCGAYKGRIQVGLTPMMLKNDKLETQQLGEMVAVYPTELIKDKLEKWKEQEQTEEYLADTESFLTKIPNEMRPKEKHYCISALRRILNTLTATILLYSMLKKNDHTKLDAVKDKVQKKMALLR
jgi:hypothetical protein